MVARALDTSASRAEQTVISPFTVKTYINRVMWKLAHGRALLALIAYVRGLVEL